VNIGVSSTYAMSGFLEKVKFNLFSYSSLVTSTNDEEWLP